MSLLTYALGGIVGAALAVGLVVQTARLENAKTDLATTREQVRGAKEAFAALSGLRDREKASSEASYNQAQTACDARLTASLRAGRVIERIINAAPPSGPGSDIIGADGVREVFGEPEPPRQAGKLPK